MPIFCYRWGDCNVPWNLTSWTWSECSLVQDIIQGFGGSAAPNFPEWLKEDTRDEEKKKRFIRLLCKIKNEPLYDESKEVRTDIIIKAKDVELIVKTVAGIDVTITEE